MINLQKIDRTQTVLLREESPPPWFGLPLSIVGLQALLEHAVDFLAPETGGLSAHRSREAPSVEI